MVLPNRKSSIGDAHSLSPLPHRGSLGGRAGGGMNSALKHNLPVEYLEAVRVMNESAMNQACELLLQEIDDASASAERIRSPTRCLRRTKECR